MVGCSGDEFTSILRALGFRLERRKIEGGNGADAIPAKAEAAPDKSPHTEAPLAEAAPAAATAAEPAPAETETPTAETSDAVAEAPRDAVAEPAFDEIWRPGKRRDPHRPQHARGKARKPAEAGDRSPRQGKGHKKAKGNERDQAKGQDRDRQTRQGRDRQGQPKRERMLPEHSPFAALKDLRDSLAARSRPEKS